MSTATVITDSSDRASAALLGREYEVSSLTSMLDQAVTGRGSALILRGEAGIGKTALLAGARQLAGPLGLEVLACSGVRTETNLPFAGLNQLLRPVQPFLSSLPAAQEGLLGAAVNLDESLVTDVHRVAMAALELLAAVAAKAPLLVTADDAHWLDRPSADVLAFIARRVAVEPIAIMIAVRDGIGDPFETTGLPSLAVRALDGWSAQALVGQVAPELDGAARERLLVDAAGNPLALVELPAALRSAGSLRDRLPLGDLLRKSFTARTAELPDPARLLLSAAAADDGCSLVELCQAASAASGGRTVAERDIQPAIDSRLARLDGDRVVFSHPLIAAAIYQSLTVGERQRIHRALAQLPGDEEDRRTRHLAAAALGPDDTIAAELEALADRAARRGAITTSVAALDRAAALVTSKDRQADLMLREAELAADLGRDRLALDLLNRVGAGQVTATRRARMLIIREAIRPGPRSGQASVTELVAAARQAWASGDTELAASVLWTAASRCWRTSAGPPERGAVTEAVHALGLSACDPRRIAILSCTATREEWPALRRDLLASNADRQDLADLRLRAGAAVNLGDHTLGAGLFGAAVLQGRRQGRLGIVTGLQAMQAWSALWSADLDTAETLASETERLSGELSQPAWRGTAALELALVTGLRGDYAAAKERLLSVLDSAEVRGVRLHQAMALHALSVAALGVERYHDAYTFLRRIVDPANPASHYRAREWVVGDLAEAAAGTGHSADCGTLIADLTATLDDHPVPSVRYQVLYAKTMLASDEAAIEACFETALAADPGGSRLAEARLYLAYGSWLRRQRRMRAARAALTRAHATFHSLGARGFADRATRELHAAGALLEPRRGDLPELTPQELQIARLAAQGLSNRQIGQQLFLSHRTVGSHLYHLFPKLGISTRAQLADALRTPGTGPVQRSGT